MSVKLIGTTSGTEVDVDTTPKALRVSPYGADGTPIAIADGTALAAVPSGTPMIIRGHADVARMLSGDRSGSLATQRNLLHFEDYFDGATLNPLLWTSTVTTMTNVQATRLFTMNAGNSVANTVSAQIATTSFFRKRRGSLLRFSSRVRFDWNNAGSVLECGFGTPSGVVANVPNGAYLRMASDGSLAGIVSYSTSETSTGTVAAQGLIVESRFYDVDVIVYDDRVQFVVQNCGGR